MGNFYTDTICRDPRFNLAKRVLDMQMLEPGMRIRVHRVVEDARVHGVELMVYETFRSRARQQALFASGASKLREVGVHNYGLAADIVKSIDGDPSWKGSFDLLGTLAHAHGLIWGGDWGDPTRQHDFRDLVHVQRIPVGRQAALFRGDFYPDDDYDPYRDLAGGEPSSHVPHVSEVGGRQPP